MMNCMIHSPHQNSSTCGIAGVCWVNRKEGTTLKACVQVGCDLKLMLKK